MSYWIQINTITYFCQSFLKLSYLLKKVCETWDINWQPETSNIINCSNSEGARRRLNCSTYVKIQATLHDSGTNTINRNAEKESLMKRISAFCGQNFASDPDFYLCWRYPPGASLHCHGLQWFGCYDCRTFDMDDYGQKKNDRSNENLNEPITSAWYP